MNDQNEPSVITEVDSWYQSTQGPQISQTLSNLAASLLPVINIALSSQGVNILPSKVNLIISIAVFAFFGIRSAIGYIKAKATFTAKLGQLQRDNTILSRKLSSIGSADIEQKQA